MAIYVKLQSLLNLHILILLIIYRSSCQIKHYKTQQTHCDLELENNTIILNCKISKCLKKYINGSCNYLQQFISYDTMKCSRECCGRELFDIIQCEEYNRTYLERDQRNNLILIIFLLVSLFVIISCLLVFLICNIKCFQKEQIANTCKKKPSEFKFSYCQICNQKQVQLQTICNHYYHYACLIQNMQDNKCPKCSIELQQYSLKIYCPFCQDKYGSKSYINMNLENIKQQQQYHRNNCQRSQMLTQRFCKQSQQTIV